MTSDEIITIGISKGFKIEKNKPLNTLTLNRIDGIQVQLYFPNEKVLSVLEEGVNINWGYKLIDNETGTEFYKDWIDIYGGTAKDKIERVKSDVLEFINKISTHKIEIEEKSAFSIFGLKFMKYKELILSE